MSTRYKTAKTVLETRTAAQLEGRLLDLTTASLLVTVYEALRPEGQARVRFDALPLDKLVATCWNMTRK